MKLKPFTPFKLPLEDQYVKQETYINELIEANKRIVEYQTLLRNSKIHSRFLLRPVMYKEAVQSTKIEGTQVTLDEVLEVDINSKKSNKDIQEAINYYKALLEGMDILKSLPISTRLFKMMHKTLLSNDVRGSHRTPGEYRRIQNFLGPTGCTIETATYIPPEPHLVDEYMSNLENYINDPLDEYNDLIRIAIIHAQFETIHPFLDGNGRIGRILIPLYLYHRKVVDYPNFFISDTLEKDKHKYYRYLNDTRYKGDWSQWIKFFLECVIIQGEKNIKLIEEANKIYTDDLEKASKIINSSNVNKLIDAMFETAIFTSKTIVKITGLSEATCRRYLTKLEEERIIFSDGKARSKTYYYYNLLDKLR